MTTTSFTRMDSSTDEQWAQIGRETSANQGRVADRVLGLLESLAEVTDGFAVDQLTHCLQTATRAERAGADDELVVASLCHDIGKAVSVPNHPRIAAEILRPYVRDEVTATILAHQDFQGRHYYAHFDMDPEHARPLPGRAVVRAGRAVRRRVGPDELRPRLPHRATGPLRAQGPGRLRKAALALMAPGQRHRWLVATGQREPRRQADLHRLGGRRRPPRASTSATARPASARWWPSSPPTRRRATSADVLKGMPTEVAGLEVSTLVVVDGGTDRTARGRRSSAAPYTCVLPVNLGQGAALRLGYALASERGARYVVTLDADGQNDPSELEGILRPVLDGEADFVIASRRLGVDQTTDRLRRAGVTVYAWAINTIIRQRLTDSSNGYRAFRIEVLDDIVPRLVQDQYQTAEVIITAASRGWRIAQRPTIWHPRASGSSKKGGNIFFGAQYGRVIARTWFRTLRQQPLGDLSPVVAVGVRAGRRCATPGRRADWMDVAS